MIVYGLIFVLFLLVIYLIFRTRPKNEIIFKEKGHADWVIKKVNGKLIVGILHKGEIIEKSTL